MATARGEPFGAVIFKDDRIKRSSSQQQSQYPRRNPSNYSRTNRMGNLPKFRTLSDEFDSDLLGG